MQKYNVGQKINEAWTILILTKCSWKDWFLSISHFGVLSQPQKLKVYSLARSKEKNRETLISNLKTTIFGKYNSRRYPHHPMQSSRFGCSIDKFDTITPWSMKLCTKEYIIVITLYCTNIYPVVYLCTKFIHLLTSTASVPSPSKSPTS